MPVGMSLPGTCSCHCATSRLSNADGRTVQKTDSASTGTLKLLLCARASCRRIY